ncbi:MAG: efflux RND transporter periplasmic adaptor subunit [Phycisphaerae bacterium]|nr:efflux RND transporter periplasmic adaptor subunit [Phycisphaerae bacterium]
MMSRKKAGICIAAAVLATLVLAAGSETTSAPDRKAAVTTKPGYIGVVLAGRSVELAPSLEGELLSVSVELGQDVSKNQIIASIDAQPIRQELVIARAEVQRMLVQLSRAITVLKEAERRYNRIKSLRDDGVESEDELERARLAVDVSWLDIEVAKASLDEQWERLVQLRQKLADTEITAPFAGTVAARYLDPGARVGPRTPIVRLISADDLLIRFAVPESELEGIRKDAAVMAHIEVLNTSVAGTIRRIAPELDYASGRLVVEAQLDQQEAARRGIKPGMAGRVRINDHP